MYNDSSKVIVNLRSRFLVGGLFYSVSVNLYTWSLRVSKQNYILFPYNWSCLVYSQF